MKTISTWSILTADVDLPGARCLRLTLTRATNGEPEALSIATAWTDPIRPYGGSIEIPGHVIEDLQNAIASLLRS